MHWTSKDSRLAVTLDPCCSSCEEAGVEGARHGGRLHLHDFKPRKSTTSIGLASTPQVPCLLFYTFTHPTPNLHTIVPSNSRPFNDGYRAVFHEEQLAATVEMIGNALRLAASKSLPAFNSATRIHLPSTSNSFPLYRRQHVLTNVRLRKPESYPYLTSASRRSYTSRSILHSSGGVALHRLCPQKSQRPQRLDLRLQILPKRTFFTSHLPNILVPPTVFLALLISLWTYKCLMTILFQDRIIYMPYIARYQKISTYASDCKPVVWKQEFIKSTDGTKLAICTGSIPHHQQEKVRRRKEVVICYFQGNGSSTPPRLPLLSNVLKAIDSRSPAQDVRFTIIALAYRGYWTSSGRASQKGIEKDAEALLQHANDTCERPPTIAGNDGHGGVEIVLWGQSIGAGIASTAAASYFQLPDDISPGTKAPITGLIMETPFTSIKNMLIGLYPQKWLPYRYLWPFLWNHWDSELALRSIAESESENQKKATVDNKKEKRKDLKVLILEATRDEVVPAGESSKFREFVQGIRSASAEKESVWGAACGS